MDMTIGKRFIVTSGVCLLLMTLLAGITINGLYQAGQATDELGNSEIPSTRTSMALASDLHQLRGDYWKRMAVEAPDRRASEDLEIRADRALLAKDLKAYEPGIGDAEDRGNYEEFTALVNEVDTAWQQVAVVDDTGKGDESVDLFLKIAFPKYEQAEAVVSKMVEYNKRTADGNTAASVSTSSHSLWLAVLIGLTALLGGTAVSWFMVRAVNTTLRAATQELGEGASQVVSASAQVNSSSQSLAQGSSEQAATIEETSAAAHEINSMAQRNTTNSLSIATMVDSSQRSFAETNVLLDGLLEAMSDIDASSQKISKVIKVIDDIAFQTNILALNAAVEAARAGEAGMGFAVVADEVRSLAQRSASASKDTALMIEESILKSSRGKLSVEEVATAIRTLTSDSSKMKVLVDEIHLGSSEQAKGLDQITNSIQEMEKVTQNTAASSEESASAAEELSAQAESVQSIVRRLEALVDGGSARQAPRTTLTSKGPATRPIQKRPVARKPMMSAIPLSPSLPPQKSSVSANEFPMEESFQSF
ncbi:HAMP domain-containing methyl-accepting chemotaxis protein [Granulicella sibirica]|uniref:Methyl-accepting chemotaxis protein I (Serine chemoreceptor protein) n=1 Tax=Granulicella sibirica TaxID=2479048 RepID=A0A4Q0T0V3_9BACT|nr:methyl-accepting chemotaxis protein [Granulicella sibirica]RXH55026.1 Methyl-accepting chemotaxis protein I (serine chemoreceptor protein) [Granulicella sibirica]